MKSSGKVLDTIRAKRIDELEQKNKDLKVKINTYDKNQSTWKSFKSELSNDMDALGKALKDLTVDNKK